MLAHLFRTCRYFCAYGWNLVDLTILVLFYVYFGLRMETFAAVGREPNLSPDVIGHPERFMPFSRAMAPLAQSNYFLAFLTLFVWFKVFKYLCLSGYFRFLVRVLERCMMKLVVFSALMLIVFFGFAVAFYIMFGLTDERFSSLSGSFLILFFMLLGGYEINVSWFKGLDLKPFVFL